MATELIQLAVGDLDVTERGTQDGVLLRDVTPRRLTAQLDPALATETTHLPWMVSRVGRHPFDVYGSLVVDGDVPFSLETQTLSMFPASIFAEDPGYWQSTMVHELSHMWFGDSVSPYEWSDLWQSEGHATWYEITWAAEHGLLAEDTAGQFNVEGFAELEPYMQAIYAAGDNFRAEFGPVARPTEMYTPNAYQGGALVLYALRQKIGAQAFDAVERAWVSRYENGVASTADFIALASQVAGRDLRRFLTRWLYDDTTPRMPGHPDWAVDPVQAPEPAPVG
jgi:aminopeptidase N